MDRGSFLRLACRLLGNGFRFRFLKFTGRPGRPQAVSLEVTHRCIARCIMCNIWKIPREVPDLALEEWTKLISSDLFSDLRELDITGGEPFLRKDLLQLCQVICELKGRNLRALRSVAITTNGFLTSRVLDYTEKMAGMLEHGNMELVMACAMDGIGEVHDQIRNYQNAWKAVNRTIKGLKEIRERHPNLIIGLKVTILPLNIDQLEPLAEYAEENGLFTIISPCIITENRYLNLDRSGDLLFTPRDKQMMIGFYRSRRFKWSYHGEKLVQYLETGTIRKPCSCGFNYFFVRSTGDLYLCPLINIKIGNIKETPVEALFRSERAAWMRRRIGRFPQCRQCTEPGLERYALPYEGFSYLGLMFKLGKENFLRLHQHMGLGKYFN